MKTAICIILFSCSAIFCTAQIISSFPHLEGFEGQEGTLNENFPDGWTAQDLNDDVFGNQGWQIIKNSDFGQNAHTDSTAMHVFSNPNDPNDDWFFTPPIDFVAGSTYYIGFWYKAGTLGTEKLAVFAGTGASAADMQELSLWQNDAITNTEYIFAEFEYSTNSTENIHFGFHGFSDAFQFILYMDDFSISEIPLNISEINSNSIQISPNPVSDQLKINNSVFNRNTQINILDMTGRTVLSVLPNGANTTADMQGLAKGVYLVTVIDHQSGIAYSERIIKD